MKLSKKDYEYFQDDNLHAVDFPMAVLETVMSRKKEFFPSFFVLAKAEYDYRLALIHRESVELENPRRPQTVIGGWNGTVVQEWEYENE